MPYVHVFLLIEVFNLAIKAPDKQNITKKKDNNKKLKAINAQQNKI
jgi:hypothetical protein